MPEIKVYGGTARGNTPLCHSYKWAGIVRGYAESQEIIRCRGFGGPEPMPIRFAVTTCSEYAPENFIHESVLEKTVHILDGTHFKFQGFKRD